FQVNYKTILIWTLRTLMLHLRSCHSYQPGEPASRLSRSSISYLCLAGRDFFAVAGGWRACWAKYAPELFATAACWSKWYPMGSPALNDGYNTMGITFTLFLQRESWSN